MWKRLVVALTLSTSLPAMAGDQPAVRIQPPTLEGPRRLEDQTAKAAVQDYLECWQSMSMALELNRPELLDRDFMGDARSKLEAAIKEQAAAGIHAIYHDRSHDLQILFYSPEGLSIELADTVEYDLQLLDHDKSLGTQKVRSRYIVVLSPTEVRWRVRIFQSQAQ